MVVAAGVFVGLFILLVVFLVFQIMKVRHSRARKEKTAELEEVIVHKNVNASEIKS